MTAAEYVAKLVAETRPASPAEIEAAARILATTPERAA